jgi:hypothetical protein
MRTSLLLAISVVAIATRPAFAQSAGHDAIALALFADGRELAARGDYALACDKFEAANQLTHWLGVELNLADCYEHVGRTASAWSLFQKAAAHAARDHDARSDYARARAGTLATELSHVVLVRASVNVPGLVLRIDGVEIPTTGFGVALPIDPGVHVLEIAAPGYVTRTSRFEVAPHANVEVAVPELAPIAVAPVVRSTAPVPTAPAARSRRNLGLWIGGAGVALAGTSLALGIDAKLGYDAAVREHCETHLRCDDRGMSAIRSARLRGDIATVAGAVGLATIAAGIIVYVSSPYEHRLAIAPIASPTTVGVAVEGRL